MRSQVPVTDNSTIVATIANTLELTVARQWNTSPPTSSLDPTALDNPVKQAVDIGEPHSRPGYSPLSCAQCSKVCTCLWAQFLIKLKDQSANELPLNTDVHEDKVPLFVCVCVCVCVYVGEGGGGGGWVGVHIYQHIVCTGEYDHMNEHGRG